MMVLSALRPDASLAEVLVHRARAASIPRLVADVLLAAILIGAESWIRHDGWLIVVSLAVIVAAYGSWGLLDRLRARFAAAMVAAGVLDALCALVAAMGIVSAAAALLLVWARALGTWIS